MKKSINPIIVGDLSWAHTIPRWLLDEIKAERMVLGMANLIKPDIPKVGDAEVLAYLMTPSLRAPLIREYVEIYVYLTAKVMKLRGKELKPFMEEKLNKGLTGDEERYLKELRHDIYVKRGGDINDPIINIMKEFKRYCDKQAQTKQQRLL